MEAMPDEEYVSDKVNLGQERDNLAWEEVIRPGPGNLGLAHPEQCTDGSPAGIP
jgi:hypothetical protein